ncbi:MAG: NADPH-dependent F420 reductase, partial [Candidatus Dormibacteraceae bacterium]
AKATALAHALDGGATTRAMDTAPDGDIVILAVPYPSAVPVVTQYGDRLAGKIIVDISNPFAPDLLGLLPPSGSSAAQQIAAAAPPSARVVKAFNTLFGHVLATGPKGGRRLDVFLAGDDAQAKQDVSSFIESLGLRPLDTGPLAMAGVLEQAGLLMMGLARYGTGHYNFALGVTDLD